jgi:hypothetical protein
VYLVIHLDVVDLSCRHDDHRPIHGVGSLAFPQK